MSVPASLEPHRRIVLLHGFTQTRSTWDPFVDALRAKCPGSVSDIVALDLPGHGDDPDGTADLWECARRATRLGGRAIYVGYSMGGRVALHCALAHPGTVAGLVLVSATAGINDPKEREARRRSDADLADRIETIGVAAFLEEWLAQPLFAGLDSDGAHRGARLANTAGGLADSLRHAGTGTQEPLWGRLGEITVPTLVVAGARDAKFTEIGRRLCDGLPSATFVTIPGAGHSVPLEAPDLGASAMCEWLNAAAFVAN